MPTTFVDITAVWERKLAAMARDEGAAVPADLLRAARRAARQPRAPRVGRRRRALRRVVQRVHPAGGERAVSDTDASSPGSARATVYEARRPPRAASTPTCTRSSPARASRAGAHARCGQDDNLMVHAAMAALQPGEVLVLTMPEPAPVALVGDLLATQAQGPRRGRRCSSTRRCATARSCAELGLPIWARWVRVARRGEGRRRRARRAGRRSAARRSGPATCVVLDADGVAVVEAERAEEVLDGVAGARGARRRSSARKLQAGELSYELDGLRGVVEGRTDEGRHRPPRPRRAAHAEGRGEPARSSST